VARPGTTDGGAFEVSMTMDGRRQLRYDWLLFMGVVATIERWERAHPPSAA